MTFDKTTVSSYTWGALAAAVLLALGSIMWAASSRPAEPRSAEYMEPAPPRTAPAPHMATAPSSLSLRPTSYSVSPRVSITPVTLPLPIPRPVAKVKVTPKAQAGATESVRGMFPVGNVAARLPRVAHPYRQIPELFPSFQYRDKMWSPTGTFATADEVMLEAVGHKVGDRGIFALANTSAPWQVLFVQSTGDPAKFAVYR